MELKTVMNDLKQHITERTIEMPTDDYVWFLRELAAWCEDQACMQEFREDYLNVD